jgi:hypothetical protein
LADGKNPKPIKISRSLNVPDFQGAASNRVRQILDHSWRAAQVFGHPAAWAKESERLKADGQILLFALSHWPFPVM